MNIPEKKLKWIQTAAFSGAILAEFIHTVVRQRAWEGYTLAINNISFLLIPLWAFCVAAVWSVKKSFQPALPFGVAALGIHTLVLFYLLLFVAALFSSFYTSRIQAART